ncbi:hypothetical protein GCM10022232_18230 [Streptomyces plumbiresistens]|uniref:Uncharacterized protein n=1 Tax=Streptomyces plumbiresistens TaxID=511811 RepID=A0ABP7QQI5_9ACTN
MTSLIKPVQAASTGQPAYSQTFPCEPSTARIGRKLVRYVLGAVVHDVQELQAVRVGPDVGLLEQFAGRPDGEGFALVELAGRQMPPAVAVGVASLREQDLAARAEKDMGFDGGCAGRPLMIPGGWGGDWVSVSEGRALQVVDHAQHRLPYRRSC